MEGSDNGETQLASGGLPSCYFMYPEVTVIGMGQVAGTKGLETEDQEDKKKSGTEN
jgi:hypothetical protein